MVSKKLNENTIDPFPFKWKCFRSARQWVTWITNIIMVDTMRTYSWLKLYYGDTSNRYTTKLHNASALGWRYAGLKLAHDPSRQWKWDDDHLWTEGSDWLELKKVTHIKLTYPHHKIWPMDLRERKLCPTTVLPTKFPHNSSHLKVPHSMTSHLEVPLIWWQSGRKTLGYASPNVHCIQ